MTITNANAKYNSPVTVLVHWQPETGLPLPYRYALKSIPLVPLLLHSIPGLTLDASLVLTTSCLAILMSYDTPLS